VAPYRITQIDDYEQHIGREKVQRIRQKAARLKGLRVANFNSTYYGGGVAEIFTTLPSWRTAYSSPQIRQNIRLRRPAISSAPRCLSLKQRARIYKMATTGSFAIFRPIRAFGMSDPQRTDSKLSVL
jgi:hypothetical protein